MHDKKTWLQMEQIEGATGKKIIRIETNDLDEMEEVRFYLRFLSSVLVFLVPRSRLFLSIFRAQLRLTTRSTV